MKFYEIDFRHAGDTPMMKLESDEELKGTLQIQTPTRKQEGIEIPIIGEGFEVKVNRTDKGLILVWGDWDKGKDERCLVLLKGRSFSSFDCDYDKADNIQLLTSGWGKSRKRRFYANFLLLLDVGAKFFLRKHPRREFSSFWYTWGGSIVDRRRGIYLEKAAKPLSIRKCSRKWRMAVNFHYFP